MSTSARQTGEPEPGEEPGSNPAQLADDSAQAFGFDLPPDRWLERVRGAVAGSSALRRETARMSDSAPVGAPAQHLGPYELIEQIGAGGMGTVWRARRDDDHFDRIVALKLIKRGMDTEDILSRFRFERQVLARLEHPHIARLYDGGSAPDGRPYLVMEYVDGLPITEYCESNNLSIDQRVALFRKVCLAVHHAHSNLVLHRDLKPGNILVDPSGEPKLLDFGIAKVLDAEGSAATEVTHTASRILSSRYASPEQYQGAKLTTATDVYSLGMVLYEMLTGVSPYRVDFETRDQFRHAVLVQEPDRPSAAVERRDTLSHARRRGLQRQLRGDLDAITIHALQKNPLERYGSAEQLSEDLRRHLKGLPLLARPPGLLRRGLRVLRRNRRGVIMATVAAFMALLLSAGSLTYWFMAPAWADQHLRRARLALLTPNHANSLWVATFWNHPLMHERDLIPQFSIDSARRSLAAYDRALQFDPHNDHIRNERDVVQLAMSLSADPATVPDCPENLSTAAPITCRYVEEWADSGLVPLLTPQQLDGASPTDLRCLGMLNMLCVNIPASIQVWSRLGQIEADPLVESLLGVLYLTLEQPELAYPRLLSAYRSYPESGFLCNYLADAAVQCGDLALAGRLLELAPSLANQDNLKGLPRVQMLYYLATDQPDKAEQAYQDSLINLVATTQYAHQLYERGDKRRALGLLAAQCGGRPTYNRVPERLMRELLTLTRRWWGELDGDQRDAVYAAALEEDIHDPQSLYAIVSAYRNSVERTRRYHTEFVVPRDRQAELPAGPLHDELLELYEGLAMHKSSLGNGS